MGDAIGFVDGVLGAIIESVEPLADALTDSAAFLQLLDDLGWGPPSADFDISDVSGFVNVGPALEQAQTLLDGFRQGSGQDSSQLSQLVDAVGTLIAGLSNLGGASAPASLPAPLNDPTFWNSFAEDIVGYLLDRYLRQNRPITWGVMYVTGILDDQAVATNDDRLDGFATRALRWDRLGTFLQNPENVIGDVYGWGGALNYVDLIRRIFRALSAAGFRPLLEPPDQAIVDQQYGTGATAPSDVSLIRLPLFEDDDLTAVTVEAGLVFLAVPATQGGSGTPQALMIAPYAAGELATEFDLGSDLTLKVDGTVDAEGGIAIRIASGSVSVATPGVALSDSIGVDLAYAPADPFTIVGGQTGSNVSLAGASMGVAVSGIGTTPVVQLRVGFQNLVATLSLDDADSFIGDLIDGGSLTAKATGTLLWSSQKGLELEGGASLTLDFPLNLELGPIELVAAHATIGIDNGKPAVTLTIDADGELGPVACSVQGIGAKLTLDPGGSGPVGGAQLALGFQPPSGAGLAVDAGPVGGGGFMSFDDAQKQYAGVLELLVPELSLTAIGLVTTLMPDGSNGFSMLVIIAVELPPVQLGFGFTLNKIGGLLGVNRGIDTDALQSGMKSGTLDSIQFPQDVVANAPKIINDIKAVFPVAVGTYVFGPMVELGWGTPSLVTLDLGLLLELPHPLRLIILGKLQVAVPIPEDALVLLQIEVLGIFDFDQRTISIDGTLGDSRIVTFPISGDLALRASYGSSPSLALSAGGFNPRFQPPAGFPSLDRMAIALADGDNPRLRLEAYFGVTSNTVQAGARLDLYVEKDLGFVGDFSVAGELGFDALVKLQPFQIIVDLSAQLEIQRNGNDFCSVALTMTISGPRPWHAWGQATVNILGSDHSIPFDVTIGPSDPPPPLPPADPGPDLLNALNTPGNWSATLPTGAGAMVSFANTDGDAANGGPSTTLVLHPLGQATVRQRTVPLDVQITTYGHQPIAGGPTTYSITSVSGVTGAMDATSVQDMFAPADFFVLTDDQKLSRPGFEPMDSGVTAQSDVLTAGAAVTATYGYATKVIDQATSGQWAAGATVKTVASAAVSSALARQSSAARVGTRTRGDARFAAPGTPVKLAEPSYALSSRSTLGAIGSSGTYTQVAAARAASTAANPVGAADLQIVGAREVLA